MTITSDKDLSRKLERTEARTNVDFVETRARLHPECGAEWIEVAGAYAMFDGVESPLTQTFGLGLSDEVTHAELDRLEAFFAEKKAPVFHEVSPMADPALMPLLNERGYHPMELTNVMYRELGSDLIVGASRNSLVSTRRISANETEIWARTSAEGWRSEMEELADFMFRFGQISAQCSGAFPFIAELEGSPTATGMLFIYDEIAMLAGASTIPEGRNQGAQTALLSARLRYAYENGCSLAIMGASPGSQSQKNAQRNGFNIAYTRTKWLLEKQPAK